MGVGSTLVCSGDGFVRQVVGHFRPRWQRGHRLWVKEATRRAPDLWTYEADGAEVPWPGRQAMASWTRDTGAAMSLPRAASRLTLIVESVRVERLADITDADARAEGFSAFGPDIADPYQDGPCGDAADAFAAYWDSLHGKGAFEASPWVAVIGFRAIHANIDTPPAPTAPTHGAINV